MKLRDYQTKAVEAVFDAWKTHRRVLVSMATGLGKTVVFAEVVRRLLAQAAGKPGGRAMVLAHREELIRQGCEKLHALTGADVQIEMGDCRTAPLFGHEPDVVVSTVQTQVSGGEGHERMRKFDPNDFGCVVVDECHHATSATYRRCLGWYGANPAVRVLGVTATPDRGDEVGLRNAFDAVAFEYTIRDAIDDGWLTPVRQRYVRVESLDVSKVSVTAGDFNRVELAEVLEEEANLHGIAAPLAEIAGTRGTLVFAASVRQAERLAEIIARTGKSARWICGRTDRDTRRRTVEAFRAGEVQFLVNVGCLTEGFDAENAAVIAIARPTRSRALYAQMVGRGTRPAADVADALGGLETAEARRAAIARSRKPHCLVVDFVGASATCKLVSAVDILAGKDLPPDVASRARRLVERDGEADPGEAVDRARAEIEREKAAAAKRRAFIRLTAKYTATEIDPFDLADVPDVAGAADLTHSALDTRRLSPRQRFLLRERLKVDPDAHSYEACKTLLDESFRRRDAGLASIPQMRLLRKYGVCVPMTQAEATATITRLLGERRGA